MSALLKWNPMKGLEQDFENFSRRLAPWFDRRRWGWELAPEESQPLTVAEWAPTVDITEDDQAYMVTAELPDIPKEDVKVAVENGDLTISGERKKAEEKAGFRYHRVERCYGSFMRSFSLPDDADPGKVSADMKDGVLHVRIEKRAGAKPKSIPIDIK